MAPSLDDKEVVGNAVRGTWDDPDVFGNVPPEAHEPGSLQPVESDGEAEARPPGWFAQHAGGLAGVAIALAAVMAAALIAFVVTRPPNAAADRFVAGKAAAARATLAIENAGPAIATTCNLGDARAAVQVTFAPDGGVSHATVIGDMADTDAGRCVVDTVKRLRIEPFGAAPQTITELVPSMRR